MGLLSCTLWETPSLPVSFWASGWKPSVPHADRAALWGIIHQEVVVCFDLLVTLWSLQHCSDI